MSRTKNPTAKADQGNVLDRLRSSLAFEDPVTTVSQVSAARASILSSAYGVERVRDLLSLYPIRYIDMSEVATAQSARIGSFCTLSGIVHEVKRKSPRPRLSIVEITLVDRTGAIIVTCFNQPWLAESLHEGQGIAVSGKIEFSYGFKRMTNPTIEPHEPEERLKGKVLALHPSTAKLSRAMMRRFIANALERVEGLYDPLPLAFRRRYRLYSRYQALRGIHAPVSMEDARQARRRLRYEELFFLELELIEAQEERMRGVEPYRHRVDGPLIESLRAALRFDPTDDQRAAIDEIYSLMSAPRAMNHLLLGDVGTGKTLVAAFALGACGASGTQALMMGPTEVLVRQYGDRIGPLLDACGVSWGVLTSSTAPSERESLCARLSSGDLSVLFGTHALLENDVVPACASLVCIDEQQRFGVEQRDALIAKAPGCDVLSMTATPIPRSLALARYGGMTLGYLRQAPGTQAGRTTTVCHFSEEGIAYDALRAALERGEQAYVICPLIGVDLPEPSREGTVDEASGFEYAAIEWGIDHDEAGAPLSAAALHARVLQEQIVPAARVGLLHGKLASAEKQRIMDEFRSGVIDVLVSTTVVEVGVDVPNATVMIIEDADRFGLAQLHQLRGRVGRGDRPGKVFLVSRSRAPQSLERLEMLERTEDGFRLSEEDLALRREGDVLGDRQHGRSPLRLVSVVRDAPVIEAAYRDAKECLDGGIVSEDEMKAVRRELAAVKEARKR